MPNLSQLPVPKFTGLEPYRFEFDNLPLNTIIRRETAINNAVEVNSQILRLSAGDQGSLSNRLNQSMNENGSLKVDAVDEILHSIGAHSDGEFDGDFYVRMLQAERDKLFLIETEANKLTIQVNTISNSVLFDDGNIEFIESDSVTWNVASGNKVSANFNFPTESAHQHIYDLEPVDSNVVTPDYKNYKTTSVSTPYMEGSLRVFINGYRLSSEIEIYVPVGIDQTLTLIKYTPDHEDGIFQLSVPITAEDIIRIDFDISFL